MTSTSLRSTGEAALAGRRMRWRDPPPQASLSVTSSTTVAAGILALWVVAIVAVAANVLVQFSSPVLPGQPWPRALPFTGAAGWGYLVDFRDTVWLPGRHVFDGGNPYDVDAYRAIYPWTQGLSLYAPAWLLLAVPLSPLPFLTAAVIYVLLGVAVMVLFLRLLLSWALPAYTAVALPAALLWMCIWAPGRYALVNVSTTLVVMGVLLVLRGLGDQMRASPHAGTLKREPWVVGAGLSFSLIKPQFGLFMLLITLFAGRWDAVWRSLVLLVAASLPIGIACVVASGGPLAFLDSIRRNIGHATTSNTTVALDSMQNVRTDALAILARLGADLPDVAQLITGMAAAALAVLVVRRSRTRLGLCAGLCALMLLSFAHQFYDYTLLVIAVCVGLGTLIAAAQPRPGWMWALVVASLVPVLHIHRASLSLVPGLTPVGADAIDMFATAIAALIAVALAACGVIGACRRPGSTTTGPSDDDGEPLHDDAVDSNLIFDLGLHKGEDAEFYLKKGYRVIGIEAMKSLCDEVAKGLDEYVESGQLTILNVAITEKSGPIPFYVNPISVWGTTRQDWARRNAHLGSPSSAVETVNGMTLTEVLSRHGTPHYLKIDIEGSDMLCVEALSRWQPRPPYMSIESEKESWRALRTELKVLKGLGYARFKAVPQHRVNRQECPNPPREGRYTTHQFQEGSSGLFGEEAPGEWATERRILAFYALVFLRYKLYGDRGVLRRYSDRRILGKVERVLRSPLRILLGPAGWYDTHASLDWNAVHSDAR